MNHDKRRYLDGMKEAAKIAADVAVSFNKLHELSLQHACWKVRDEINKSIEAQGGKGYGL